MWPLIDWINIIAAARALLAGQNPYLIGGGSNRFFNPVWALAFVIPFCFIRDNNVMQIAVIATMLAAIAITATMTNRNPSKALVSMAGVGTMGAIFYGNVDPFVWLGLLFPLPLGILILAIKPQATFLVIAVLILRRIGSKGLFSGALALVPTVIATLAWFYLFGLPDWNMSGNLGSLGFWPYGLIVGLPLAGLALWRRSVRLAMLAAPFCVPYISVNSFIGMSYAYPVAGFVIGWARVIERSLR